MITFNVYRRESNDSNPPVAIATGLTSMAYSDDTAEEDKTYLYSIGAMKSGFEKISNELLVSTYNLIQTGVLGFYYGVSQISITESGKRFLAKSNFVGWVHFGIKTARNVSSSAYYAEVTLNEMTLQYADSLSLGVSTTSNLVHNTVAGSNGMYQYQSMGIFKANNSYESYGAAGFVKGDKVGVLINKNSSGNTDVTFYVNGISLGVATTLSGTPDLYMALSLYNSNFNLNVDLLLAETVMPEFAFPVLAW